MGIFFILCLLNLLCAREVQHEKVIFSDFRESLPSDGKNTAWPEVNQISFTDSKTGSDNIFKIKSQWDFDSLYFLFETEDMDLRAYQSQRDHAKLFIDDMVEVLIDPQNDKDSCWQADDLVYHINILGTVKDDRGTAACVTDPSWNGRATYSVLLNGTLNDTTDVDKGYAVLLSIPWSELNVNPDTETKLTINFANGDNDGKGRQLYDWSGAWPMRSLYAFGDLILMK